MSNVESRSILRLAACIGVGIHELVARENKVSKIWVLNQPHLPPSHHDL